MSTVVTSLCVRGMTHRFPPDMFNAVQCSLVEVTSKFRPSQIKFFRINKVVLQFKKVPGSLRKPVNHVQQQNINAYMHYTTNISKLNNGIFLVATCLLYKSPDKT